MKAFLALLVVLALLASSLAATEEGKGSDTAAALSKQTKTENTADSSTQDQVLPFCTTQRCA